MAGQIADRDDFKRFVDGYDEAIRFMEHQIGRLCDTLVDLGVMDDTSIVISADHGEAMGAGCLRRSPPRWRGRPRCADGHPLAGSRQRHISTSDDGLLHKIDFHPPLGELLGIPIPSGWDGQSFAAAARGEERTGRPYLVWDHALYSCQRAVRTPGWLFIRTYHPGLFPFDDKMLYDMRYDPHHTINLAADRADVVARMDSLLQEWLQMAVGHPGSEPDPMPEVVRTGPWKYVKLDEWMDRLRSQGRDADAETIIARLGLDANLRTRNGHVPV